MTDTEISEIMQFVDEQDHKPSFVRCDRCGALVPAHESCVNCDSYIFCTNCTSTIFIYYKPI